MSTIRSMPASDTASILSSSSSTSTSSHDPAKKLWCDTQWTNLSCQARRLDLPKEPYFDPQTMLLSKEVNLRLWKQLSKLYSVLGPDRAPLATPVMVEGGEVKWFSYMEGSKGQEADIFDKGWLAGWVKT